MFGPHWPPAMPDDAEITTALEMVYLSARPRFLRQARNDAQRNALKEAGFGHFDIVLNAGETDQQIFVVQMEHRFGVDEVLTMPPDPSHILLNGQLPPDLEIIANALVAKYVDGLMKLPDKEKDEETFAALSCYLREIHQQIIDGTLPVTPAQLNLKNLLGGA